MDQIDHITRGYRRSVTGVSRSMEEKLCNRTFVWTRLLARRWAEPEAAGIWATRSTQAYGTPMQITLDLRDREQQCQIAFPAIKQ